MHASDSDLVFTQVFWPLRQPNGIRHCMPHRNKHTIAAHAYPFLCRHHNSHALRILSQHSTQHRPAESAASCRMPWLTTLYLSHVATAWMDWKAKHSVQSTSLQSVASPMPAWNCADILLLNWMQQLWLPRYCDSVSTITIMLTFFTFEALVCKVTTSLHNFEYSLWSEAFEGQYSVQKENLASCKYKNDFLAAIYVESLNAAVFGWLNDHSQSLLH